MSQHFPEAEDFRSCAEFIEATLARIASLRDEGRREQAQTLAHELAGLAWTIRECAPTYGYNADLLFGDLFTKIEEAIE
jgi:hypothetical protein